MSASLKTYKVGEFAALCGVSVRTLHYYDRLGLLRPGARSASGYRLYASSDIARLQQIVTLKFIGLSLDKIKILLGQRQFTVLETLATQRELLVERRRQIDDALRAIDLARETALLDDSMNWNALARVIEVIEMQKDWGWVKKYYSEEQLAELATRDTAELREKSQADWAQLISDVEGALGSDPASPTGQALAKRWRELVFAFTQGNPAIQQNLNRLYSDQQSWPANFKRPWSDDVDAYIKAAMACSEADE